MKLSKELKKVFIKLVNPFHLAKVIKLQKNRKLQKRTRNDAQLKLYSEILTGDFLHYGFFNNPDTKPEDISLSDMEKAQYDYANLFLDNVTDKESPILDVGCGMGGLSNLLQKEKMKPVALTPDINQINYIKRKYPQIWIEAYKEQVIFHELAHAYLKRAHNNVWSLKLWRHKSIMSSSSYCDPTYHYVGRLELRDYYMKELFSKRDEF